MNLSNYTKKDLLLSAIKSEVESNRIYTLLAEIVENGLMKDKFIYLAREEQKHKHFLESIFKNEFSKDRLVLPEKTPVPLPEVTIPDNENIVISTILTQSIEAEKAAADFCLKPIQTQIGEISSTSLYTSVSSFQHTF